MFRPEERAAAMAIYTMGPLIGPVIGPIAGGFIAETIGFKWVFIIISIIGGVASILGILLLRETYHPVLRARLVKQCVSDNQKAKELVDTTGNGLSKGEILWINMTRPIAMCKSFILFILSLFMAM
jgi:MFS family permease